MTRCRICSFRPCRCADLAAPPAYCVEACRQNKPNESLALKVPPQYAAEMAQDSRVKGVPTEFKPDGTPVFSSRGHKQRYCRAYGYVNRDGGYGD